MLELKTFINSQGVMRFGSVLSALRETINLNHMLSSVGFCIPIVQNFTKAFPHSSISLCGQHSFSSVCSSRQLLFHHIKTRPSRDVTVSGCFSFVVYQISTLKCKAALTQHCGILNRALRRFRAMSHSEGQSRSQTRKLAWGLLTIYTPKIYSVIQPYHIC